MKNSPFETPQNVFMDVVDVKDYVQLDRVSSIYQALKDSVKKPLKMILLFGKPGTGKSMLLNKLHSDLSKRQKVVIFHTPIIDESEFLITLAKELYDVEFASEVNFTQFDKIASRFKFEEIPLLLLDEAQLYSASLMEKIRLLSDSRKIKFVISLHKTEKEDIIAKEHFQTRIWESIELVNATRAELKIYIQKKLMKANSFDVANMFNDNNIKTVHKHTNGNYRDTNKLMFSLFQIYSWYEENQPTKINYASITPKIIEMAAIHTGLLDA